MTKNEERRQEILKNALDLFVEKSYHQTCTSEISERTGIAAGTLFNYFKKKEDIINTLYIQIKKELYSVISNKKPPDEHIFIYLKRNWLDFVSWGVNNYKKVLFVLQMEDSPIISEKIKNKIESELTDYALFYQEGITQGLLKEIPLKLGILSYFKAMLTTINYLVKYESKATKEQHVDISEKAFNNYLYGIRI
ncbi:MAG: TetR/AcrR family transcriptional regulator [Promethearchaeota archaeon]